MMTEYRIKTVPEDFIVTEFPKLDLDISGNIACYILTKKGISTFDAIEYICKELQLSSKNFDFAGLKDEDGITIQYISYVGEVINNTEMIIDNERFITINYFGKLSSRIKTGTLYGNGFNIVIRNLEREYVESIDYHKKEVFYINYFDSQRFGMPGKKYVTHFLGKAIEQNDKKLIDKYCIEGGQSILSDEILNNAHIREKVFFLNSWQSFLWNEKVKKKVREIDKNAYVKNENGIEYLIASQECLRNYYKELSEMNDIRQYIFTNGEKETLISNTRNVVQNTTVHVDDILNDEIFAGKMKIRIHFSLEKGSYATMLIKHYLQ